METPIYIIGTGAIGLALAVCLKQAQKEVILIRGSVDDGTYTTQTLTLLTPDGSEHSATVAYSTLRNFTKLEGIVLITTKSFGNNALADKLNDKIGDSPLVLLQNGLGIERPFTGDHFAEVYRCVLFATSQVLSSTLVRYKPVTVSPVGLIKGSLTNLESVVEQINSPLFPFRMEPNIQPVIWEKAIINSVFNSICPLLEVDNGLFHRDPTALAIARQIIDECVAVARLSGVSVDANAIENKLILISQQSDGQLISTLVDIQNKRETEIDTLNFEIVRLAEQLNPKPSVERTRLLGELTRLKSRLTP